MDKKENVPCPLVGEAYLQDDGSWLMPANNHTNVETIASISDDGRVITISPKFTPIKFTDSLYIAIDK